MKIKGKMKLFVDFIGPFIFWPDSGMTCVTGPAGTGLG